MAVASYGVAGGRHWACGTTEQSHCGVSPSAQRISTVLPEHSTLHESPTGKSGAAGVVSSALLTGAGLVLSGERESR
jgi:hypothetical protein